MKYTVYVQKMPVIKYTLTPLLRCIYSFIGVIKAWRKERRIHIKYLNGKFIAYVKVKNSYNNEQFEVVKVWNFLNC